MFFMGNGLLAVSGRATVPTGDAIALWMQVRNIGAEHRRLWDAGVTALREPRREVWGLDEMWIADPDGVRIVLLLTNEPPRRLIDVQLRRSGAGCGS